MLISKKVRQRLLDVHVYRGAADGVSDHFLVEGRLKVIGRWRRGRGRMEGCKAIKVGELRN